MTAREVATRAEITLDHGARSVRPWRDGFVVASHAGHLLDRRHEVVTVVDGNLHIVRRVVLEDEAYDVALADDGVTWAWIIGPWLHVGNPDRLDDATVAEMPVYGLDAAQCQWMPGGRGLWVAHYAGDDVLVEIRERDLRVARRTTVPRVPTSSGFAHLRFLEHPAGDSVVLHLTEGDDSSWEGEDRSPSWLLTDDGAAICAKRLPLDDVGAESFGPDGTWWIKETEHPVMRLVRISWPMATELGTLSWASIDPQAEAEFTDAPALPLVVLPGGYAAWATQNGRIHIIDLTTMTAIDEITIAGHPLEPGWGVDIAEEELGTDLSYAWAGNNGMILTEHKAEDTLETDRSDVSTGNDATNLAELDRYRRGPYMFALTAARDWSPDPDRTTRLHAV
jgi:hypothetical protein